MKLDSEQYKEARAAMDIFVAAFDRATAEGYGADFAARVMFCATLDVTMDQFGEKHVVTWLRNTADELERRISKQNPVEILRHLN